MELTIEQALQQGVAAHREGKLSDAERLYRAILQSQPAHPDANHNLGVLAVSVNKVDAALPLFKTALEANPKIEQFWLSYIDALIKGQQFENAKQVFEQAKTQGVAEEKLDVLEDHLALIVQAPKSKLAEQKRRKKKSRRQNVKGINPSQKQLSTLLEYYQNGRFNDTENLAMSLTQEFPKHPFAWKVLGAVLNQLGRIPESVVAKKKVVKLAPNEAEAHSDLGNTLKELGRLDEAEASYNQAIALKPDFAEAHSNLGITLQELSRLEEAEASYNQAIALKPDFAEAHSNLGWMLQGLGRLDEAEASCRQTIALKPDFAEAHSNLGVTLQELGRLDEAVASYSQAIALKPAYARAHYNLGITLQELSRLEEAEASYNEAIALKPDFAEAHSNLGWMLQGLGRLDEAEASCRQTIALKPDFAEAHSNLGVTLQELGRLDEAEASYKQAIELQSDFAGAFWNLHTIEKTIQGAEHWIDQCLIAEPTHLEANLTKAALKFYRGDRADFDNLMQSKFKLHSYMRSFSWIFSLPNLPELHFNRLYFFDAIIKKSITSKPFYEFGVWRASSFKYLIKVYKKGYGFDTFTGLPEDWLLGSDIEKKGTYSSGGNVPKIKGGEFIVGKFEDTLPVFFSESRPTASVINFDADLYSSTICALNFSKSVMDKDTILIFDELIMNESWEKDEFKALNEFCSINDYSYEVIAISFFTKQVAIKLIGI